MRFTTTDIFNLDILYTCIIIQTQACIRKLDVSLLEKTIVYAKHVI